MSAPPSKFHPIEVHCAYHEAGHAVAHIFYLNGAGLVKVTLHLCPDRADQYSAHNSLSSRDLPPADRAGLEGLLFVMLAGSVAGRRWAFDNAEQISNPGDVVDRIRAVATARILDGAKAQDIIALVEGAQPQRGEEAKDTVTRLLGGESGTLQRAERAISDWFTRREVWEAVEATAELLLARREVPGDQLSCQVKFTLGMDLTEGETALLASIENSKAR